MSSIFKEVLGHEEVVERLQQAVVGQRLAQTLLFTGPHGVGKKKVALGLAQALVCGASQNGEPCGTCAPCVRVANEQSESLLIIGPQNNQIKMDQAREVIQFFSLQMVGLARLVIIDQAELLNVQSANALLKTLEEPPPHSYIVLLSSSATSVLSTIHSRSQIQRFAPLSREQLKQLTGAEDWIIEAAQGRASEVQKLCEEDLQELRLEAFSIWKMVLEKRPMGELLGRLQELGKDKQQSLMVVRLWQQLLRDSRYKKDQLSPLTHQDFIEIIDPLSEKETYLLDEWSQGCLQLEKDILGNLDRSLSFQSFLQNAEAQINC